MAVIGSLSVKLGLVTVEWAQATTEAKRKAKELQTSLNELAGGAKEVAARIQELGGAFGLGAIGLGELIKSTLEYSNQIKDLASGFGISIAKTLQFRDAIETSGGNADKAQQMLGKLYTNIQNARSGNETAIAQFEQMGISLKELSGMSTEQAITRIFKGLADGSENSFEKVKLLRAQLGKGGLGLDVQAVSEKLTESLAKYKQYEESIKKAAEVNETLKTTLDNLKIAFADLISPFASGGLVTIEQFKAILVAIGSYVVVGNIMKMVEVLKTLSAVMKDIALGEAAITSLQGGKGLAQLAAAVAAYEIAKAAFENQSANAPAVGDAGLTQEEQANQEAAAEANRHEIIAAQAKIELAKTLMQIERERVANKIVDLERDKYSGQLEELKLTRATEFANIQEQTAAALNKADLSEAQRANINGEAAQKMAAAQQKYKDNVILINAERDKEVRLIQTKQAFEAKSFQLTADELFLAERKNKMSTFDYAMAQEEMSSKKTILGLEQQIVDAKNNMGEGLGYEAEKTRIQELISNEKALSQVRKDSIILTENQRRSFTEGWNDAFRKFAEDAQNYGKLGGDMFGSVVSNMNSAIDQFTQTGKWSFHDFATSVIRDIAAMILKMQAMQLVMMAIGWVNKTFGVNIGGLGGSTGGGNVSPGIKLPGLATGGELTGPSIVGENGPELLVPTKSGGRIIPNTQMGAALSSQPQVVYNGPYIASMSAIDTQSATQFLAKNKTAVWSANQSSQRSLPQSR
jgi:hypothetical protein